MDPTGAGRHLLIVDCDVDLVATVGEIAHDAGWTMTPCFDPVEAHASAVNEQPDVILLDIRLDPVHGGWRVLRQLRADSQTAELPVVLFSADEERLREVRDWPGGAPLPILPKPFELEQLYAAIEGAICPHRDSSDL
jgi:DNA-binding response OmpR family regulator